MKRTDPLALVVAAVLGGGVGFLVDHVLTTGGRATFTPPMGLSVMLVLLGVGCIALAWPVRRSTRDPKAPRVDPFRALRIAVLAKASSILGAAIGGAALGMIVFLTTRPVAPQLGSMGAIIATAGAGVVLVAAALIAEYMCTLPKDPDDTEQHDAGPGTAPTA